jgi:pyroglutamyl-peptidase
VSTPTLLATGFDVFPGAPENPTAWAIGELQREGWQPKGARLVTAVFPVRYDAWETMAKPLLAREKPQAVVAFGLSAKTTGFTLESTARNVVGIDRPDFFGARSTSDKVVPSGPPVYPSSLPFVEIVQALKQADLPLVRSDDAGDYLCNMLFYNLMHGADTHGLKMAGFIHAPYLTTQIERLTKAGHAIQHGASLAEADFLKGVKLILQTCANKLAS